MKRMLFVLAGFFVVGLATAHISTVNLNKADVKQLATLKGIGLKKATAIVNYRKQSGLFHTVDDLTRVKGIGKNFLSRLLKRNPGRIAVKTR